MYYDVNTPKYTPDSILIATSCNRVVEINNKPFYEIDSISIQKHNLVLEFGEEWRVYDPEWKDKVKFIVLTSKNFEDIQIYYCKTPIAGKDYKQGYYYVPANKVKSIP